MDIQASRCIPGCPFPIFTARMRERGSARRLDEGGLNVEKRLEKMALALALLLLLSPLAAAAELRRGDSGDEVYNLQLMLFETGWIFELPDGRFGKNTEKAVQDYESHAGLPVDGVADEDMLSWLEVDWHRMLAETGQLDPSDGYAADVLSQFGSDGLAADGAYPPFCNHLSMDGSSVVDYCETHAELCARANSLKQTGAAADAQQACELWRAEIVRLYDLWLQRTEEDLHGGIIAARALFLSAMEGEMTAIRRYYDTFQIVPGEAAPAYALEMQLRSHAAWLCALVSGALAPNETGIEQ